MKSNVKKIISSSKKLNEKIVMPENMEVDDLLSVLLEKGFKKAKNRMIKAHGCQPEDLNFNMSVRETMDKIKDIESQNSGELEKLAIAIVIDELGLKKGEINIETELVSEPFSADSEKDPEFLTDPEEPEIDDFYQVDEIGDVGKQIGKRALVDTILYGIGNKSVYLFDKADDELEQLDPLLPHLYHKFLTANDFMSYVAPDGAKSIKAAETEIEAPREQGGKWLVKVKAFIFPVLVAELLKAVMKVYSYHSLPKGAKKIVLEKAKQYEKEIECGKLGDLLYEKICAQSEKPYDLVYKLFDCNTQDFESMIPEFLLGTKKSKSFIDESDLSGSDDLTVDGFDLSFLFQK